MTVSTSLRLARGGEKALVKPRPLRQQKSEKDLCACEFRIAPLMLGSLLSSSRSLPDLGDYASLSGKPKSNKWMRARSGSYSLSTDAVLPPTSVGIQIREEARPGGEKAARRKDLLDNLTLSEPGLLRVGNPSLRGLSSFRWR